MAPNKPRCCCPATQVPLHVIGIQSRPHHQLRRNLHSRTLPSARRLPRKGHPPHVPLPGAAKKDLQSEDQAHPAERPDHDGDRRRSAQVPLQEHGGRPAQHAGDAEADHLAPQDPGRLPEHPALPGRVRAGEAQDRAGRLHPARPAGRPERAAPDDHGLRQGGRQDGLQARQLARHQRAARLHPAAGHPRRLRRGQDQGGAEAGPPRPQHPRERRGAPPPRGQDGRRIPLLPRPAGAGRAAAHGRRPRGAPQGRQGRGRPGGAVRRGAGGAVARERGPAGPAAGPGLPQARRHHALHARPQHLPLHGLPRAQRPDPGRPGRRPGPGHAAAEPGRRRRLRGQGRPRLAPAQEGRQGRAAVQRDIQPAGAGGGGGGVRGVRGTKGEQRLSIEGEEAA